MKAKISLLLVIANLFVMLVAAQPSWIWSATYGNTGDDDGYAIATDGSGNVYVAGNFQSPFVIFGSDVLINAYSGLSDIFLVKFDPDGNVLWAVQAGGNRTDRCRSLCVDPSGNVYIAGQFAGTSAAFGGITLTNADPLGDFSDVFVAKYNASGAVQWAKKIGGYDQDEAYSITTDINGDLYVTGTFYNSTLTIGSNTLNNHDSNGSTMDIFIAKYNSTGNVLWATAEGGAGDDVCNVVKTDNEGNLFVAGNYQSSSMTLGTTTLTNISDVIIFNILYADAFVAKYDSNGVHQWAKTIGGDALEGVYGLAVDGGGNVYAAGNYYSPVSHFGSNTISNTDITGQTSDIFIAGYDKDGNLLWTKSNGGPYNEGCTSLCQGDYGNICLTGWFYSNELILGNDTLNNSDNTGNTRDFYITKINSYGDPIGAIQNRGGDDDIPASVVMDANGAILVTGLTKSSPLIIGNDSLPNAGGWDMFVAKLDNTLSICEIDNSANINVYPNPSAGRFFVETNNFIKAEVFTLSGENIGGCLNENVGNGIDLSKAPAGIYMLKITYPGKIFVRKLIKY